MRMLGVLVVVLCGAGCSEAANPGAADGSFDAPEPDASTSVDAIADVNGGVDANHADAADAAPLVNYPAPGWPQWTSTNVMTQRLDGRNPIAHVASWSAKAINEYDTNHGGMGSWSTLTPLKIGSGNDGSTPVYAAKVSDPTYTIHCTLYKCDVGTHLEGMVIHVPTPYVVENGGAGDGHMAVISPDRSEVYDFYQTTQPSGGVIKVSSGTRFLTNGIAWSTTYGGAANAAQAAFAAGVVTAEDFLQGAINHSLLVAVPCESGKVYPTLADPDGPCSSGNGAPMGGRLWLDMTDGQIDALAMPVTKTLVAKALAHYGAFIMDSEGVNGWAIHRAGAGGPSAEAAAWQTVQSTLLGGSNVWLQDGWPPSLVSHFHFLDPCVTQLTC